MVSLLNGLDEGTLQQHSTRRPSPATPSSCQDAVGQIHSWILPEAKRHVERRWGSAPTGVPAVASLLNASAAGYGAVMAGDTVHVPLRSLAVDEPADDLVLQPRKQCRNK